MVKNLFLEGFTTFQRRPMTLNSSECVHPYNYESAPREDVIDGKNAVKWFYSEKAARKNEKAMDAC